LLYIFGLVCDSRQLKALASLGFLINLFNLLPVIPLGMHRQGASAAVGHLPSCSTNCDERQLVETIVYAHTYTRQLPRRATALFRAGCASVRTLVIRMSG
jgi:hypothetical protein